MSLDRDKIIKFVADLSNRPAERIDDSTALFSSNLLDSYNMMDLIHFIEFEQDIRVGATDVSLDNLDSVQKILEFLGRKAV